MERCSFRVLLRLRSTATYTVFLYARAYSIVQNAPWRSVYYTVCSHVMRCRHACARRYAAGVGLARRVCFRPFVAFRTFGDVQSLESIEFHGLLQRRAGEQMHLFVVRRVARAYTRYPPADYETVVSPVLFCGNKRQIARCEVTPSNLTCA